MSYLSPTNDPIADFDRYEAEQQRRLERCPKCDYCNKHITEDNYYDINGDIVCEECLDSHFKRETEDYIE